MATKYPLDMLITARKIREDNAQRSVVSARNELNALRENIENKKVEVQHYEEWRKEEEVRRFIEIQNTTLSQKEMDKFKWGIAALKARTLELEEEVMNMEAKIPELEQKIDDAIRVHKEAISEREKIEEHKQKWIEDLRKENDRLEDLELEEFRTKDSNDELDEYEFEE